MLESFITISTGKKNIIDKFDKTSDTVHIGMDFNIDPMCAVIAQIQENKIFIIDEIQIWSSNTTEMVEEIKRRYQQKVIIYPDPSARQRKTSAAGFTDITILKNAGFEVCCRRSSPLVRDRINAVNTKLKNANGMSTLFVLNTCKTMIKCIERQVYKENTNVPDKESGYDHFNDAIGYLVEYLYPLKREFKPTEPQRWT